MRFENGDVREFMMLLCENVMFHEDCSEKQEIILTPLLYCL